MDDYQRGAIMAVVYLLHMHDSCVEAVDVVIGLNIGKLDVSSLLESDKAQLKKIQGERDGAIKFKGLGIGRRSSRG